MRQRVSGWMRRRMNFDKTMKIFTRFLCVKIFPAKFSNTTLQWSKSFQLLKLADNFHSFHIFYWKFFNGSRYICFMCIVKLAIHHITHILRMWQITCENEICERIFFRRNSSWKIHSLFFLKKHSTILQPTRKDLFGNFIIYQWHTRVVWRIYCENLNAFDVIFPLEFSTAWKSLIKISSRFSRAKARKRESIFHLRPQSTHRQ